MLPRPRALTSAMTALLALLVLATGPARSSAQGAGQPKAAAPADSARPAVPPMPQMPQGMGAPKGHDITAGATLSTAEITRINDLASDSATAGMAVRELKSFLRSGPEGMYRQWAWNTLLQAQVRRKAPIPDILTAADSAITYLSHNSSRRVAFYASLAQVLGERPEGVAKGLVYVDKALDAIPPTPDAVPMQAVVKGIKGTLLLHAGDLTSAIAMLTEALADSPDSLRVLGELGRAHEKAQQDSIALGYYLRAVAAFPVGDSTARVALTQVWTRQKGSAAGLDERIAAVRTEQLRRLALEGRKVEGAVPEFTLTGIEDSTKTVTLAALKGKVAIVDFWGSWCGPCRMELPLYQALWQKHKDNPAVVFLGIGWERGGSATDRRDRAAAFRHQLGLDFPTVIDFSGDVVKAFGVEGFPTAFVIDRDGRMRFANRGYSAGIDEILELQLTELLK
jgi:thiol-disulfide isomerase/thioredoxin